MSVAIRAITRLQDADDLNVSLGAGVDEYALTYDHDTAKFVLRAVAAGVTDHGALSGLSDDDHSQYLLATGARAMTGALSIPLAAAGNKVVIDMTNTGNPGAVRQTIKMGRNTGSRTVEFGAYSSSSNFSSPSFIAYSNEVSQYLLVASGGKLGIGDISTPAASIDMRYVTTVDYLVCNWLNTGGATTGITDNVIRLGRETSDRYIEFGVRSEANMTLPSFLIKRTDGTTVNTVYNMVTIDYQSPGTPAAGFGAGLLFQLESSTTAAQSAARIQALWYEATHATRKADLVLTAFDTAEREGLRIRGNGSAPALGVLGATPIARKAHVADPTGGATVDAEARAAINLILASLEDFGFHATS